jgi:hypothetical protein
LHKCLRGGEHGSEASYLKHDKAQSSTINSRRYLGPSGRSPTKTLSILKRRCRAH